MNPAGVEIILNMREKMGQMQNQIQEFVATLNRELPERGGTPPSSGDRTSLTPIINVRVPARRR